MTNVIIPSLAESITEAEIGSWIKKDGERVRKSEPILELQTDKASLEIVAEVSGFLRTLKAAGDIVKVGEIVARIEAAAAADAVPEAAVAKEAPEAAKTVKPAVLPAVVERATAPRTPPQVSAPPAPVSPAPARTPAPWGVSTAPGERRERMSRMRRRIAERLVEAQHQAAILTTFNEVDMSNLMGLRERHQEWFTKRHGMKLGYMSLFSRAVIGALAEAPGLNAFIDGEDVVYHDHVHLGIAVQTDKGLVVPVVRDAQTLGLGALEKEIARLANLARAGKIGIDDLAGGTFTISNGGIFGSLLSTPILNPPQSGILGMHAIQQRPICLKDGSIVGRPMMYVALSYDHRLIDGREAVTFLVRVKERLEDPDRLMLEG